MGWSGRAPAPPAISWPGAPRQGARHVPDTQYRDRRDRHRYRQKLTALELVGSKGPTAELQEMPWPTQDCSREVAYVSSSNHR